MELIQHGVLWNLKRRFRSLILRQKKRVFIFIDGLDECFTDQQRQPAHF